MTFVSIVITCQTCVNGLVQTYELGGKELLENGIAHTIDSGVGGIVYISTCSHQQSTLYQKLTRSVEVLPVSNPCPCQSTRSFFCIEDEDR